MNRTLRDLIYNDMKPALGVTEPAAIALAAALSLLMGGGTAEMEAAVMNMAASITGMICTGGNHCCCLKVHSAIDSAFNAAELASSGVGVKAPHGILDPSVEKTLQNVGLIADPGMTGTERTIVEIMSNGAGLFPNP